MWSNNKIPSNKTKQNFTKHTRHMHINIHLWRNGKCHTSWTLFKCINAFIHLHDFKIYIIAWNYLWPPIATTIWKYLAKLWYVLSDCQKKKKITKNKQYKYLLSGYQCIRYVYDLGLWTLNIVKHHSRAMMWNERGKCVILRRATVCQH